MVEVQRKESGVVSITRLHCPSKEPQLQAPLENPSNTTCIADRPLDVCGNPLCPECGSINVKRDGHRYLKDGSDIQRWICKQCIHRFSEREPLQKTSKQSLNTSSALAGKRQICAILEEAKNLDPQAETKTNAGEVNQTQHGYIVEFQWKMKKRNKAASTIQNRTLYLSRLVKLGADLMKPDTVETVFATEEMTEAVKFNAVKAYVAFTKAYKIEWEPIEVQYEPEDAFDPLEEEIDLLINACSKVTKTFSQVAKDTGARVGEIRKIQWTDVNEKNNTIAINHPEKGSKARTIKVHEKTIALIKNLKKNHGVHIFNPTFTSQRKTFNRTRKRMAEITNNPRLLQIHFHTLRHWRASREYEKTGDIYEVKKLLGHKAISSTDRYQHGSYSSEEYVTKRPQTSQEEDTVINAGYEYVRFDDRENVPIYRKRK
jgi:integrase